MLLPSFTRPHSPSPLACPMQPDRFPPSGRSMAEGFEVRSQPTDQPSGRHNKGKWRNGWEGCSSGCFRAGRKAPAQKASVLPCGLLRSSRRTCAVGVLHGAPGVTTSPCAG